MLKNNLKMITLCFVFISLCPSCLGSAEDIQVNVNSYILIDPISGRVLMEKASYEKYPMASTTKVMTAIIALERGDISSKVITSPRAASVGGSSFWLRSGEEMTLENMLYGLLLPSGNDAAVAIAEHIAGDEDSFVELMNQKALELGAINTRYKNPHGLDAPGHYTTARDLSIISRYAWSIPKFREIVGTPSKAIKEGAFTRQLYNTNRLLTGFNGANGIKTGYTGKAGRCLTASATRDGLHLMSVVLGADDHFSASYNLLSYGFSNYKLMDIIEEDAEYASVPVKNGVKDELQLLAKTSITLPVREGEMVEFRLIAPKSIDAPIVMGHQVGEIEVFIDNKKAFSTSLIASTDIRKRMFFDIYLKIIDEWVKNRFRKTFTSV